MGSSRTAGQTPRSRESVGLITVTVLAGSLLLSAVAAHARPAKTLFKNQPTQWQPFIAGDGRPRSVRFEPAWTFEGFDVPFAGDPVISSATLIVASEDGRIVGLDPELGRPRWETDLRDQLGVGPAADDHAVYQATRDGRLVALDARNGSALWSVELLSEATHTPRKDGDRLLVGTADEALVAIDAHSGRILNRRPLPGRPTTPPEPVPGAILIGTDHGMLLALEPEDLEVRWRHYAMHAITAPPLYHEGRVYVASAENALHCLRFKNGKRLWSIRTGAVITARPFVVGSTLYVLCYDNDIYLLKPRSGHLLSRVRLGHRLDVDAGFNGDHVFIVPFTEASLVGLALPSLQTGGQFDLGIPGEWFTTAPIVLEERVAVGYGRDAGRIMMLSIRPGDDGADAPKDDD